MIFNIFLKEATNLIFKKNPLKKFIKKKTNQ